MEVSWLHKNNNSSLIIFCNGWGMDQRPFESFASSTYDVYHIYNYDQLPAQFDIEIITRKYDQVVLIGWSMGVWAGQKLFAEKSHLFHRTIAINGTLCPIDDDHGIPEKIYDRTLKGYDAVARLKFYRRMCREKTLLRLFLAEQPRRTIDDQRRELVALRDLVDCLPAEESIYREIIISENDWIVPSVNQRNFWQGKNVTEISGFHFLFYSWQSWDHLLCYTDYRS